MSRDIIRGNDIIVFMGMAIINLKGKITTEIVNKTSN